MAADPPPTPVPPTGSLAAGPGPVATPTGTLDGALAIAVLALAVFLASFAAVNSDVWLHLAAGRLVAHGNFPFGGGDPFSAAAGAAWVHHAWLFDLFLYLLYEPGGMSLVVGKAVLVAALAAVLLAIRRPTGGVLGPAATTTLVLLAASPFFLLRSQVASYLLFAVLLFILHRGVHFAPRDSREAKWKTPLAVGILFLLWANLDGGFVFGLLLLVAWLIGAVLQRTTGFGDGEPADRPGMLVVALLAAVVGSVINPYHLRAFCLPEELAPLTASAELWRDDYFRHFFHDQMFVSLVEDAFVRQAGWAAAGAMYLLLAVGLVSFAVNTGGWRWQWVLAWAAFAWLGATYARLAPYLAIVAGPAAVLNVQAVLARRRSAATTANPRVEHLRATLAALGRSVLLLAILLLLALAWPGWLGPDAREAAPNRRVAWRAVPDPTFRRLAERLNGWYQSGELREGAARGFHYPPSFSNYCAWFCPAEKGILDQRLTAPPEAIADYLAVLAAVRNLNSVGPDRPGPPDPLLTRAGITHLVMSGPAVLQPPPAYNGLGLNLFLDPARWPLWAIDGRGTVVGWRNSYPKLRLDPARLATGNAVEPVPPPPASEPVGPPPTIWDRYVAAPAPVPPETYEAGLWLAYSAAAGGRLDLLTRTAQVANLVGRLAPAGLLDPGTQILNPTLKAIAPQQVGDILRANWQRRSEGRTAEAAHLLAVRAARRAIRVNQTDPEAFERLTMAYGLSNLDPSIGPAFQVNDAQQITAARQAVNRLAAATHRPTAAREELMMQEQLYELYRRHTVPGTQAPPLDLIQNALERLIRLVEQMPPNTEADLQRYQAALKTYKAELEALQARVKQNRDNWETGTVNKKPVERALAARQYGLAGEALRALREADVNDLTVDAVVLMAHLAVLAGEAESAREWLTDVGGPGLERIPPQLRPSVYPLMVQIDAAVGDYRAAIEHSDEVLVLMEGPTRTAAGGLAAELVLPAAPAFPLTRAVRSKIWGNMWLQGWSLAAQRGDWLALQGVVALEGGEIPLARHRLEEAVGLRFNFGGRRLAGRWLEVLGPR